MNKPSDPAPWEAAASKRAGEIFRTKGVRLSIGGEPTFVPVHPKGAEWNYSALGPCKEQFARSFASELLREALCDGVVFMSPGKQYPGEPDPRWAFRILHDGPPVEMGGLGNVPSDLPGLRRWLAKCLGIPAKNWMRFEDPRGPGNEIFALLLDHAGGRWISHGWELPLRERRLLNAGGAAGLRLPLDKLREGIPRRALAMEKCHDGLHVFFPPLMEKPFCSLLALLLQVSRRIRRKIHFHGYVPQFPEATWKVVSLASDPGVLEVNLPPCETWEEYARWNWLLHRCAKRAGLRTWREDRGEFPVGTGGGHHLLFGSPLGVANGFYGRPEWVASLLAFWQRHPALSYLFTGQYVGASSQAPRADESVIPVRELVLALGSLRRERKPHGPLMTFETLRHLLVDASGNPHRAEISLDKFHAPNHPAGLDGLIEFRALETLPRADWFNAVALLWVCLAAHLLLRPFTRPPVAFGDRLHDEFFLPTFLWADLLEVLGVLERSGFSMQGDLFREIWEWKFPVLLNLREEGRALEIRRAHESWPLLAEVPLDGGATSRFVDSSLRRMEFAASSEFVKAVEVFVNGRRLDFHRLPSGHFLAGLRYRHSNLYPSLHPSQPVHLPLLLQLVPRGKAKGSGKCWELVEGTTGFRERSDVPSVAGGKPIPPAFRGAWTHDLRF